ncbi:unnamed protein product [Musa acuminata subsp. burmannicoides]
MFCTVTEYKLLIFICQPESCLISVQIYLVPLRQRSIAQTPVQFSHGKPMDKDQGWRNPMYGGNQHGANYNHDMAVDVGEGSEDDRMVAAGIALGYQHYATDDDM